MVFINELIIMNSPIDVYPFITNIPPNITNKVAYSKIRKSLYYCN